MNLILAKKMPDGLYRYITVYYGDDYDYTAPVLKNFYSHQERADKLFELGNLYNLGPSPYGGWTGTDDQSHCRACIRDCKESRTQNIAAPAIDLLKLKKAHNDVYLFEGGRWYYITTTRQYDISCTPSGLIKESSGLSGLKIYEIDYRYSGLDERRDFACWDEMKEKALQEKKSFYVFSNHKLISVINKLPLKTTNHEQ